MSSKSFAIIAAALTTSLGAAIGKSKTEYKIYKAEDGSRVVIANKPKEGATPESVVAFYTPDSRKVCSLDFSSGDGEHGFGVVKAAWTPDENYLVFSLTSSGGHQAWHTPTLFYSLRTKEVHSLDSYISAAGISKADFALKSPNTILTEVWKSESESVSAKFRLDSLASEDQKSRHFLRCADGRVFRVDPYDLQNHD